MTFRIQCSSRSGGKSGDCGKVLAYLDLPSAKCLVDAGGKDRRDGYLCVQCAARERAMLRKGILVDNPAPRPLPLEAHIALDIMERRLKIKGGDRKERMAALKKRFATADTGKDGAERLVETLTRMAAEKDGS